MGRVGQSGAYTPYYTSKLKQGEEYQDAVTDALYRNGLLLITYCSEKRQLTDGENRFGMEIKYDDKLDKTGNLFFETAEKRRPENPEWIPSGILRRDNSWLYAIGNFEALYIFPKQYLPWIQDKHLRQSPGSRFYSVFETAPKTSKGWLTPGSDIEKYAIKKVPIDRE